MAEKAVTESRVKVLIAEGIKALQVDLDANIGKQIAQAVANLATKEAVAGDLQKVIENLQNFVTKDALSEILSELITKDQWNEALEGMVSSAIPLTGLHPDLELNEGPGEPIPGEYLAGLVFRSSKSKKTETGKANVPFERPLSPGDVLNWKDTGDTVVIITADGQKYTVDKE